MRIRPVIRHWMVDIGVAAAVLATTEIAIATGRETDSAPRDWLAYLLGVAMAAPLLARRRFPATVLYVVSTALLVFYMLQYPGFPPSLVLAVPLYDATRSGHLWRAVPVPVLFLSTGLIVAIRHGMPPLDAVSAFLPQFAVVLVAVLLGALMRSRSAYAAEVRQRLRLAKQEREREAERRVAEERLRIARELHDTVGHAIATITVQSGAALHLLDSEPGRAREALSAIRSTGKAALAEMRAALDLLHSGTEPPTGGDAGLHRLPDLLTAVRAAGLTVEVDSDLDGQRLAGPADHAAYRILQESLTNVLRHAGPQAHAQVHLRMTPKLVTIEVSDDGVGADTGVADRNDGGGRGVAGMRGRTEALGGRFEAGPNPGVGFTVRAVLPVETMEGSGA